MATQYSVASRNNRMAGLIADIGINAQIIQYGGVRPASVAAALTGAALVQFAGNATQFGTATAGVMTASAVANANALAGAGAGTVATHYRINTSAGAAVLQGTIFQSTPLTTGLATAANSNVLNFAATTGVVVGMTATGTGYPLGAVVIAVTATTVTLNTVSAAGVAGATVITFGGDMNLTNTKIASGQTCQFNNFSTTAFGA